MAYQRRGGGRRRRKVDLLLQITSNTSITKISIY